MNLRKLAAVICIIGITSSVTAFADDAFEWVKAKKVKVSVNGSSMGTSALLTEDGSTMLPLRDIANQLQGMVEWDDKTQTVKVYKPNVHVSLLLAKDPKNMIPFGDVEKGKHEFVIFTQVDSIYNKISAIKTTIEDPFGDTVYTYEDEVKDHKENLWMTTPTIELNFKQVGKYTVKIYMKPEGSKQYALVSQKVIRSLAP
ncbi:stalk domain-containing protein [Marinicrinis lubricantis]|uniref:Stalk domain-containing protein n=1 Tax=Marinicrinis lubricantis TaxID=2086470 RepID=A0ABW1IQS1_9BACL